MAFRKQCDYEECGKMLGSTGPFLQLHGSMSEQLEEYGNIEYRYLTPHAHSKMAFCDGKCLVGWVTQEQKRNPFIRRPQVIPNEGIY